MTYSMRCLFIAAALGLMSSTASAQPFSRGVPTGTRWGIEAEGSLEANLTQARTLGASYGIFGHYGILELGVTRGGRADATLFGAPHTMQSWNLYAGVLVPVSRNLRIAGLVSGGLHDYQGIDSTSGFLFGGASPGASGSAGYLGVSVGLNAGFSVGSVRASWTLSAFVEDDLARYAVSQVVTQTPSCFLECGASQPVVASGTVGELQVGLRLTMRLGIERTTRPAAQ